jgi:LmbE family N-acetylglucosaminyl deacetylase
LTLTTQPNIHIDITATIDRKIAALLCHKSQVGPEAGDWVREWNAETGKKISVPYAEAFRMMRFDRDK